MEISQTNTGPNCISEEQRIINISCNAFLNNLYQQKWQGLLFVQNHATDCII